MSIGENILNLRKSKNLSQEQLGEKVGVTRQTISNWELNETIPDTNQLISLSKELNVSIDELVNNDIKSILVEKVSNTEKLAGILIKILKVIGILIAFYIILMVTLFICFNVFKKQSSSDNLSTTLNCSIEDKSYEIIIGDDKYYTCDNCSKEMNVYLKDITDWANLRKSETNINKYFTDNGGSCK